MNDDNVDPKVKRYFPWGLFLALALVLMIASCLKAHGAEKPTTLGWSCETVKAYLATHTTAEAYAKAAELKLPKWLIRKAEKCVP